MSNQVNKNIKRTRPCRWDRDGDPICNRCQQNNKKRFCTIHYRLWDQQLRALRTSHHAASGDTALGRGAYATLDEEAEWKRATLDEAEWRHWDSLLQSQTTCRPTVAPAKRKRKMQMCRWNFSGESCTKQAQSSNRQHLCKRHNDAYENRVQQGPCCMTTNALANVTAPVVVGGGTIEGEFHTVQGCVDNANNSLESGPNVGHADIFQGPPTMVPDVIFFQRTVVSMGKQINEIQNSHQTMWNEMQNINQTLRALLESQLRANRGENESGFLNGCTGNDNNSTMSFASTLATSYSPENESQADMEAQEQSVIDNQETPEKNSMGQIPAGCIHNVTTPRRRTTSQNRPEGSNAGLTNYSQICYANAMLQLIARIAKGNHVVGSALFDPKEEHQQRFPLYFKFASVIRDMISRSIEGMTVNTHPLMGAFIGIHKEFDGLQQRTYCFVV